MPDQDYRLDEVLGTTVTSFLHEYDFGDSWQHGVSVQAVELADDQRNGWPMCLAGANACPPEDVGGLGGYAEFLQAIGDPSHDKHDAMWRWHDGPFDPKGFDVNSATRWSECPISVSAGQPALAGGVAGPVPHPEVEVSRRDTRLAASFRSRLRLGPIRDPRPMAVSIVLHLHAQAMDANLAEPVGVHHDAQAFLRSCRAVVGSGSERVAAATTVPGPREAKTRDIGTAVDSCAAVAAAGAEPAYSH